jgi:hypothetical protein
MSIERPFFNESTAQLAQRIDDAKQWFMMLHTIYVELSHREKAAAKELRAELAQLFAATGGYFPWPTTNVVESNAPLGSDVFQFTQGVLGYMGYKVGKSGCTKSKREALLEDVYCRRLPNINSTAYMSEWGAPKTAKRLRKIAISIAEFAKSHKKHDAMKFATAIRDWEADLEYLRLHFYEGKYSFGWPETSA